VQESQGGFLLLPWLFLLQVLKFFIRALKNYYFYSLIIF